MFTGIKVIVNEDNLFACLVKRLHIKFKKKEKKDRFTADDLHDLQVIFLYFFLNPPTLLLKTIWEAFSEAGEHWWKVYMLCFQAFMVSVELSRSRDWSLKAE